MADVIPIQVVDHLVLIGQRHDAAPVSVASAATVALEGLRSNQATITGNTTITSLGQATAGLVVDVTLTGAPLLTFDGTNLVLPTGASIQGAAGDTFRAVAQGGVAWVVTAYQRASGAALASSTDPGALPLAGGTMTGMVKGAAGADLASASTVNLAVATGNYVKITGTTTITALGTVATGTRMVLHFAGILTLTHHATSLILPTAANITTAAGDVAQVVSLGSGNWRCVGYMRADGTPLVSSGGGSIVNTTTTGSITIPATGSTVSVATTAQYAAWAVGQNVYITDGTYLMHGIVTAVGTLTLTVRALGFTGDTAAAGTIASGALVNVDCGRENILFNYSFSGASLASITALLDTTVPGTLEILFSGLNSGDDYLCWSVNGDNTSGNYHMQEIYASASTTPGGQHQADTQFSYVPLSATYPTIMWAVMADYTAATKKAVTYHGGHYNGVRYHCGDYQGTAAISSVTFTPGNGTLASGSVVIRRKRST